MEQRRRVLRVSKDARFSVEVAKPGMAQVC